MGKQLSRRIAIAFLTALALVELSTSQAKDLAVDIELVLAVDVSASGVALFDRTLGYCAWAVMNSRGERILSPE